MSDEKRQPSAPPPPDGRRSRGQSLVELALLAPVLAVLLFGVVESGRLFYAWVTVQHAARMGTRFAVTGIGERDGTRLRQIQHAVLEAARGLSAQDLQITIRSWHGLRGRQQLRVGSAGGPCDLVEVDVQYTFRPIIPLIGRLLPEQMILRGSDRKMNEPWMPCEP